MTSSALTIAGFDPSSGAGVTADLHVFAAHGVFGTSAITALTVQSTMGVQRVECVSAALLAEMLAELDTDLPPDGIKIGMLGGMEQARAVAEYVRAVRYRVRCVVLDPVIESSSGAALLQPDALSVLRRDLLPLVNVVTPNIGELRRLTGARCATVSERREAVEQLTRSFAGAVVLTAGDEARPDDLVYSKGEWTVLPGEHIATQATHGTGCAFSSAVLCGLLQGKSVPEAAARAKRYVATAMRSAEARGGGRGPMNLLWPLRRSDG